MSIPITVGVSASSSATAQSGGPFTNNAQIVFGSFSSSPTDITANPDLSATSTASTPLGGTNSGLLGNAPVASSLLAASGSSSLLIWGGLLLAAGVGVWLILKR